MSARFKVGMVWAVWPVNSNHPPVSGLGFLTFQDLPRRLFQIALSKCCWETGAKFGGGRSLSLARGLPKLEVKLVP